MLELSQIRLKRMIRIRRRILITIAITISILIHLDTKMEIKRPNIRKKVP